MESWSVTKLSTKLKNVSCLLLFYHKTNSNLKFMPTNKHFRCTSLDDIRHKFNDIQIYNLTFSSESFLLIATKWSRFETWFFEHASFWILWGNNKYVNTNLRRIRHINNCGWARPQVRGGGGGSIIVCYRRRRNIVFLKTFSKHTNV